MTEIVVHVTKLEEWKAVLDNWFKQGYKWVDGGNKYNKFSFNLGSRYLLLLDDEIWKDGYLNEKDEPIEYADFMAQQEKTMAKETYYVTQEQLDLIIDLKTSKYPLGRLVNSEDIFRTLSFGLESIEDKAVLSYLGGDETIEFKVKEQLYRLWRIDDDENKVYMDFSLTGNPDWTHIEDNAFTAPLEEIKKWQTPAWEIEEAE